MADPYAEFGGKATDPYAEFGGKATAAPSPQAGAAPAPAQGVSPTAAFQVPSPGLGQTQTVEPHPKWTQQGYEAAQAEGNPLLLQKPGPLQQAQQGYLGLGQKLQAQNLAQGGSPLAAGFNKFWTGSLADLTGLIGQPAESLKNTALTAGAAIPYVRTALEPYFAYQGYKMLKEPPQPGESQASHWQRAMLGTSMIVGSAAAAGKTIPKEVRAVSDFARQANSLNDITKGATGLYQGKIQPMIQTLQGAMRNEGARTIQQAIEADKAASINGRGTISAIPAMTEAAKAMEDTGHTPTPQTRVLLNRLMGQPDMTLEEAQHLRSDLGGAASKAERAGNAKLSKILWGAYDQVGEGMASRIEELQGTRAPYEHYNNEFKASFELNKGVPGEMMESIPDRHDAIPKLEKFSSADLSELKDQMQKYRLNPGALDAAQRDAKALVSAHKAIGGRAGANIYRIMMHGGTQALLPMGVYLAARGAGLYGFAPYLVASAVTGTMLGENPKVEAGRILRKLNLKLPPEAFRTRTEVQGPQTFNYPNPDEGWTAPPKTPPSTPNPGAHSGTPEGAQFDNQTLQQVQAEHPEMSVSQQLQEAAKRSTSARTPGEPETEQIRRRHRSPDQATSKQARADYLKMLREKRSQGRLSETEQGELARAEGLKTRTPEEIQKAMEGRQLKKKTELGRETPIASEREQKVYDFIGQSIHRASQEALGQGVLDDMEDNGVSPRNVSRQFWDHTYFNLPTEAQAKFRNYLARETGFKPGDTIGFKANKEPIVAQDWAHIAKDILDVSDDPTELEGTTRGLVALMKVANDRFAEKGSQRFRLAGDVSQAKKQEPKGR